MHWPAMFVSAVLVAPLVAQSQQPSPRGGDAALNGVTLRAGVLPGTHGGVGNLSQVEMDPGAGFVGPRRIMYWFYKNSESFKDHAGHRVEITGTIVEVHDESLELKATDGVFAEIQGPTGATASPETSGGAVGTSGNAPNEAAATAVSADASETNDPQTTVVKVVVDKLRMLGTCR